MSKSLESKPEKVHIRAILLGVLMMPIHSYWITKIESIVYKGGGGSTDSLIWTSVYNMAVLVVISYVIRRWFRRLFLGRADLLAIFAMCNIAACVACQVYNTEIFRDTWIPKGNVLFSWITHG